MDFGFDILAIMIPIIVVVLFVLLFVFGYVSAKPNEAIVITGLGKPRTLIGRSGFMIPFIEKRSYISIEQFSTDVQITDFVPTLDFINVKADAVVKVKVGISDELLNAAAQNFLNWKTADISASIQDVLEGNLREIIGQMELRDMVNNRQAFAEKVQSNAAPDLAKMGLEIIAFTVQSFTDDNDVIKNLGIDNIVTIQKDAANARAKAEREQAEVRAREDKAANDARVAADLEIAKKQNELAIEQANLKRQSDVQLAQANAAYGIEEQAQRKEIERATAEANIVKQQKEAEVKAEEVKVREQELSATIRKQAEAELYETQREAEAQKARAEAAKYAAEQEAAGIEAKGRAEAEAIRLKLEAEAEGLSKKADAMAKFNDAAVTEMVVNVLPEIAKNIAAPLGNVDKITMYGEGNASKMVGDLMTTMDKTTEGLGLNVRDLISATLTGRAMSTGLLTAQETKEAEGDK
ncbi:SPFH domain-containing protein [Streptococcus suis]|uniref:flotillin family protein n=1 Tax=Streptococcus suis TaxID=1307 RepID=UPI0019233775|nr:flotillin family protein [Streptococcus suis]MBL1156579.1 flotillin family protein [Streptococcus suis]